MVSNRSVKSELWQCNGCFSNTENINCWRMLSKLLASLRFITSDK